MGTERSWVQLSPDEKMQSRWDGFVNAPVEFASAEAEQAYRARATRIRQSIRLEGVPDRVPVLATCGLYPAISRGVTPYEAMHDHEKAVQAWLETNRDLQPDAMIAPMFAAIPARAFEILDVRILDWPGRGLPKDVGFQYNEQEWMREDEYDLLIDDPTDFMLHVWLPRVVGGLEGFAALSAPMDTIEIVASPPYFLRWANPDVKTSLEKLLAAADEVAKWGSLIFPLLGRLVAEGWPGHIGAMSKAPFDVIGDTFRGTRGIMMDIFRRPDAVIEACDRLAPLMVKWVTRQANPQSPPVVFMPLHKGADAFMSDDMFARFYWPSLRKVILGLNEEGFVPHLFAEGGYNSRLEMISDVPPGKTNWHFDRTDMRRAKEVLGDIACIQGNVPISLLQVGTPEDVSAYAQDLIGSIGTDGGFILDAGAVVDEAKGENMRAMIRAAKEFETGG
jgi:uroporphyrinogen-III decarboxylase